MENLKKDYYLRQLHYESTTITIDCLFGTKKYQFLKDFKVIQSGKTVYLTAIFLNKF